MDTQLCFSSVTHLAERISRHELSPVDVVEAHLQRIATLDPRLFAFLEVTADAARRQAKAATPEIQARRPPGIG